MRSSVHGVAAGDRGGRRASRLLSGIRDLLPASSSRKTGGRSLPAASAWTASRRALRSLADKRPSRKSWRRKSAAGRSLFRELQLRQQETRLRNELLPDWARGTT